MALPKDVDITQLSVTYLSATIRDLEQQADAKKAQAQALLAEIRALLQERDAFERELEKRVTVSDTQGE